MTSDEVGCEDGWGRKVLASVLFLNFGKWGLLRMSILDWRLGGTHYMGTDRIGKQFGFGVCAM